MDRLSIIMVKTALLWLVAGVVFGGLMLVDRGIPGNWRLWMMPTHGHMLFVGWLVQFALGIGYWLLPRKRSPELPIGYRETPALVAAALLNLGLALRVIGEPMERTGHAGPLSFSMLSGSSLFQVAAVVIFVFQLWPRIYGKGKMGKPPSAPARKPG